MITLYDRYETAFSNNGLGILEVYDDVIEEELNGVFKLTFKYPKFARLGETITNGMTLRADTPEGWNYFRIWSLIDNGETLDITAHQISFDLYFKFIEDKNLVTLGGQSALTRILEDTPFTAVSDVTKTDSVRLVRKTVQQAIFSDDENSFLTRWGGEFKRTGFTLNAMNRRGRTYAQNPANIRYGKDLVSYESTEDESTYYNRVMPIGYDGLLLPEKYVDRVGIDLNDVRTTTVEYQDIKAIADPANPREDEVPLETAYTMMRDRVAAEFLAGRYDAKANYRVEFVDLASTVEYENKAVLVTRYLGDEVKVVREMDEIMARVISYRYCPTLKEYISVELGNFEERPMNFLTKLEVISKVVSDLSVHKITEQHVTDLLTSALGGYVEEYNGQMYIMDTPDPMTATKIWRWNLKGLGYSGTGINGPYTTAITMDGVILGSFIQAYSISTNQLKSDVGQTLDLTSNNAITSLVSNVNALDGRLDTAELAITHTANTSTVRRSTAYTTDLNGKEQTIIKQTTAPAHLSGRLWLDTSVTPNILKRSTGTAWVKATPTTASEVGAYSSTNGTALAGRVTTAESKITQNTTDITSKVSTTTYDAKMQQLDSSISTVTQTANNVRLDFDNQIIGGENLVLNSGFKNKGYNWELLGFYLETATSASDINSMKCGGGTGSNYVKQSIFKEKIPEGTKQVTLSAYVKGASIVPGTTDPLIKLQARVYYTSGDIGYFSHGSNFSGTFDWTRFSTTITLDTTRTINYILVYGHARDFTGTIWYDNFQLEIGNKLTSWKPAANEIYSGYTNINADGITIGKNNETIETKIANDGLCIVDGSTEIASFTNAGAVIDNLSATYIRGNVFNINRVDLAFDIGIGKEYSSVAQVISILDKTTFAMDNKYISFNLYGEISENIILRNFHGSGNVYVQFVNGARLNGNIRTYKNTTPINFFSSGTGRGAVVGGDPIVCDGDSYIRIDSINIKGTGDRNGIYSKDGANVFVLNCDISNVSTGMRCEGGAQLVSWNNIGTCSSTAFNVQWGARLYYSGQYPYYSQSLIYQANAGMFWVQGATSMVVSAYNQPAVVDTTFVNIFNPTQIRTWNATDGFVSTYYGATAAQNRWDSTTGFMKGQITFGSDVYNYIADRKAGTTPTVQIRLKRKYSTHGTSSGVAPTPYNFTPNTGFNTATRGAWTGWVTIPYTLITSTGYTFEFYNGTTGLTYAIWDASEISVTKVKTV